MIMLQVRTSDGDIRLGRIFFGVSLESQRWDMKISLIVDRMMIDQQQTLLLLLLLVNAPVLIKGIQRGLYLRWAKSQNMCMWGINFKFHQKPGFWLIEGLNKNNNMFISYRINKYPLPQLMLTGLFHHFSSSLYKFISSFEITCSDMLIL